MGNACEMHGTGLHTRFWQDKLKKSDTDGRVILKCSLEKYDGRGGVQWIHLVLDIDQWWTPVNMVMNLQIL